MIKKAKKASCYHICFYFHSPSLILKIYYLRKTVWKNTEHDACLPWGSWIKWIAEKLNTSGLLFFLCFCMARRVKETFFFLWKSCRCFSFRLPLEAAIPHYSLQKEVLWFLANKLQFFSIALGFQPPDLTGNRNHIRKLLLKTQYALSKGPQKGHPRGEPVHNSDKSVSENCLTSRCWYALEASPKLDDKR